ncbi:MAG: substrate-binding domain-containing protein, partial [Microlunatus sp.]|nr:substrate-binding domain-containing protein [Microlunatus sp.]
GVDNVAAARAATEHLIMLGRRRIAALGTISDVPSGTWGVRLAGYRAALQNAGITVEESLLPRVKNFQFDQGAAAMRELLALSEPPDAIFCFSDMLAIGALSIMNARGIRVPDDIAVMGWDDVLEARYAWPPLTSVRVATDVVARVAVDYLLKQLNGAPIEPTEHHVSFEIVPRRSTIGPA